MLVTQAGRPITKEDAVEGPEGIGLIAGDSVNAMFGFADGPLGFFSSVRDAGLKQPNFGLTLAGTKGAIHIRPDNVPHAYLREAPLWRTDKDFPWKPIGPDGVGGEIPSGDVDRAAERAGWARRAALDLIDSIREDREPATGMYAGRTTIEMTTAINASSLAAGRLDWPLEKKLASRENPLA